MAACDSSGAGLLDASDLNLRLASRLRFTLLRLPLSNFKTLGQEGKRLPPLNAVYPGISVFEGSGRALLPGIRVPDLPCRLRHSGSASSCFVQVSKVGRPSSSQFALMEVGHLGCSRPCAGMNACTEFSQWSGICRASYPVLALTSEKTSNHFLGVSYIYTSGLRISVHGSWSFNRGTVHL